MKDMHLLPTFTTIIVVLLVLNIVEYGHTQREEEIFEACPITLMTHRYETGSDIGTNMTEGKLIVNGTKEDIKILPFVVQLYWEYQGSVEFKCGATIISERFVLSAAHCVDWAGIKFFILAGSSKLYFGERYDIEQIYTPPEFNFSIQIPDIVVLQTRTKIKFTDSIKSVKLPTPNEEVAPGTKTTVVGWGIVGEGQSKSSVLMGVQVPILSDKNCKRAYPNKITKYMVCAGYKDGMKGACYGDSGGPLEINGKIVGIVSWSVGCARPNCPAVYSKVSKLIDWITNVTGTQV